MEPIVFEPPATPLLPPWRCHRIDCRKLAIYARQACFLAHKMYVAYISLYTAIYVCLLFFLLQEMSGVQDDQRPDHRRRRPPSGS